MCVWTKKRGSMNAGLRERWVLMKIPRCDTDGLREMLVCIRKTARERRWVLLK